MLQALLVLLVFQWAGQVLVAALGVSFPGALAGTLLLLALLLWRQQLPAWLEQTGNFLLQHMMLLFIPTIAGVMLHFDRLSREWLPFVLSCVLGAVVTLAATAVTFQWMLRRTERLQPTPPAPTATESSASASSPQAARPTAPAKEHP